MTKEFLAGVKTEGLVSMLKQHIISEWGGEQVDIMFYPFSSLIWEEFLLVNNHHNLHHPCIVYLVLCVPGVASSCHASKIRHEDFRPSDSSSVTLVLPPSGF